MLAGVSVFTSTTSVSLLVTLRSATTHCADSAASDANGGKKKDDAPFRLRASLM
jgi:hypothetical protein